MLIVKDGLILAVSRKDNKELFGFCGGKLNDGETTKEAAIRETKEEVDITVTNCESIFQRVEKGEVDFLTDCYYAVEWSGVPKSLEDCAVEWLTVEEITSTRAAFGEYNRRTIETFKKLYPNVVLK